MLVSLMTKDGASSIRVRRAREIFVHFWLMEEWRKDNNEIS